MGYFGDVYEHGGGGDDYLLYGPGCRVIPRLGDVGTLLLLLLRCHQVHYYIPLLLLLLQIRLQFSILHLLFTILSMITVYSFISDFVSSLLSYSIPHSSMSPIWNNLIDKIGIAFSIARSILLSFNSILSIVYSICIYSVISSCLSHPHHSLILETYF